MNKLLNFAASRVLVCGDVMLDRYWYGDTKRISPEGPVPIVNVGRDEERPGGAGNVALSIAALGGVAHLLGIIADDAVGRRLQACVDQRGISTQLIAVNNKQTINKLRVLSRNRQVLRLDFDESYHDVDKTELQHYFAAQLSWANVMVLSDYAKGTLSDPQSLLTLAREHNIPTIVDPKGEDFTRYRHATILTPNMREFTAVVGECANEGELERRAQQLMEDIAVEALLITRSEYGMTLVKRGESPIHLPTSAREVYDVTGAGDTVVATLAVAIGSGLDLANAIALANTAAAVSVKHLGAANVTLNELNEELHKTTLQKIINIQSDKLNAHVSALKKPGERMVFTCGCFDVIHATHIVELTHLRQSGDKLIVGVYSDAMARSVLGEGRPIHALEQRMELLAHLESVDWLIPIDSTNVAEEYAAQLCARICKV